MKNYNPNQIIAELSGDIDIKNKLIIVDKNLGLSKWGKIDFLVNHCGYKYIIKSKSKGE